MEIQEYSRSYSWTNLGKITDAAVTLWRANASESGCMDTIGQINRVTVTHYHTGGTGSMTFTAAAQLKNGSTLISGSDFASVGCGTGTPKPITNTFTELPTTVAGVDSWNNVYIHKTAQKPTGYKYYTYVGGGKAVTLTVYFYRQQDLCPDADAPTFGGVTFGDDATIQGGTASLRATFGSYIEGYSRPTISIPVNLDFTKYDYIQGKANLAVTDPNGDVVYNAETSIDTNNRTLTATLGGLNAGTHRYTATVTDSSGQSATKTGTFAVTAYTPPKITWSVRRYDRSLDASGAYTYEPNDGGEYVRFNVSSTVQTIGSNNRQSITLTYGATGIADRSRSILSSSATLAYTASKADYTSNAKFNAGTRYWFTMTVADRVTTVVDTQWIDVAGAIFDIEPYGVAVGMRSSATASNPMFEVSKDMPLIQYGMYDTNEHIIGTIVRNGKEVPVYEQTIINDSGFASPSEAVFGTFSAGGDFDIVLNLDFSIQAVNGNASTVPTSTNGWITGTHYYAASNWRYVQVMIATGDAKVVSNNSGSWIKCITCTMRYTRKSDLQ